VNEFSTLLEHLGDPGTFPAALATLVDVSGSSYRRAGARLLLTARGTSFGTLSGGCLEADVLARCARVREASTPEVATYDTREENDLVWGVGLGCHGVVRILIEPLPSCPTWVAPVRAAARARQEIRLGVTFGPAARRARSTAVATPEFPSVSGEDCFIDAIPPPFRLLVFGAGDDARPLVRFGAALGWEISVFDPRPALPTRERFPEAVAWHTGSINSLLGAATTDERTGAVIMTHHYVHDLPLLAGLRPRPLAYLGLLGPRARGDRLLREVAALAPPSVTPAVRDDLLHAPVGLDLGGDGPAAVALSIVSEIQCRLSGRDGRPLRERSQPIHPR
jgi:xanthine/CO dehydrogenase XdhC/CoxF family maturation factor